MTPKEASEAVGKKVYGFGFDKDPVEKYLVISVEQPTKKNDRIRMFTLQDESGVQFKTGINDYFMDEVSCIKSVTKDIAGLISSCEKEIASLQNTVSRHKRTQLDLDKRLKKAEHLQKIKKL